MPLLPSISVTQPWLGEFCAQPKTVNAKTSIPMALAKCRFIEISPLLMTSPQNAARLPKRQDTGFRQRAIVYDAAQTRFAQ